MAGIQNVANNCFLSSILQLLTISPDLYNSFKKNIYIETFKAYNNSNLSVISVSNFIRNYNKLNEKYEIGTQHDASEALNHILDDASNKIQFQLDVEQNVFNIETVNGKLVFLKPSRSIVNEIILSTPMKKSLQESIDSYFETVEENIYDNISVNGKTRYSPRITYAVENAPNYLFVNLKRFDPDTYEKNIDEIDVPQFINCGTKTYKIIAYIIHIGKTNSGHYVTVKNISKDWYLFDDIEIIKISDEKNICLQKIAYIYLLRKCNKKEYIDLNTDMDISDNFNDDLNDDVMDISENSSDDLMDIC